jgi:hypothetical protein
MKIPNKIKIAGITYTISNKKNLYHEDVDKKYHLDGLTDIDSQNIFFDFAKEAGEEYKELHFFHELTHLLFYYSGIGKSKLWDNEQDVHNFSVLLHQVLRDNNLLKGS